MMKICKDCQHKFEEQEACPVCGSTDFEEITDPETVQNDAPESTQPVQQSDEPVTENTAAEQGADDEPVPVVGLIIAGVIGLIALAVGIYFKLKLG